MLEIVMGAVKIQMSNISAHVGTIKRLKNAAVPQLTNGAANLT